MNAFDSYSNPPLETLDQFKVRIGYQYEPLRDLTVPANQHEKIDSKGNLAPYLGDTVIFELSSRTLNALEQMQRELHFGCYDLLCSMLPKKSFHVTLHDLLSAPDTSTENRNVVLAGLEQRSADVEALLAQFRSEFPRAIRLIPTKLFSMVGRSIVLGFEPADEYACRALMHMYRALQHVVSLPYPLTPHVTLAYYKPPMLDANGNPFPHGYEAVDRLRDAMLRAMKYAPQDVRLSVSRLHHRCFWDMSRYISKDQFLREYANKIKAAEFVKRQTFVGFFVDQMTRASDELKTGKQYYTLLPQFAADGLNLSHAQAKCRWKKAHALFGETIDRAYHYGTETKCFSDQPEYEDKMERDILAAVILMNMRERGMLTEESTGLNDVDLIYTCLYELKW